MTSNVIQGDWRWQEPSSHTSKTTQIIFSVCEINCCYVASCERVIYSVTNLL